MQTEKNFGRILIVDDEANARMALAELLKEEGYKVDTAADAFKALGKLESFSPHLVLTDLKMPGMDGIELMEKIRSESPPIPVVVMTAYGAVDTAVSAMRKGAADYLVKPLHFDELLIALQRTLAQENLRQETVRLRARIDERLDRKNIIGHSAEMNEIFELVNQVAATRSSVLIEGESGTGKELVAQALHQRSPRRNKPFIKVHCAALAEGLLESELFGHERGAFTGAVARKDGRFHIADGGTLFLDEIGEISPALQVKLLRFLQEHEFERVGGNETIKVDVRVIAATNRNLKEEVDLGNFREDLFYRLNVIGIVVPPLRDRRDDILPLADHFLTLSSKENSKNITGMSQDCANTLRTYNWPGNVRELENAVERAVVMCRSAQLQAGDLPSSIVPPDVSGAPVIPGSTIEDIERYAILQTLEATSGSTSKAAKILGISVRKIQYKLHHYQDAPKSGLTIAEEN
ncbi:MAG: sigma-54-dependent Fis family transcriptional regulator [Kofleriaceae bacterium]|nr:sigma-54-dependent Fis family transcriptional regulator [Kofleriaceae bacterium]